MLVSNTKSLATASVVRGLSESTTSLLAGVTAASVYSYIFYYLYVEYIAGRYFYFGFGVHDLAVWHVILVAFMSVSPGVLLIGAGQRLSLYILKLMYFLVYVPAIIVTSHASRDYIGSYDSLVLSAAIWVCFLLLSTVPRMPLLSLRKIEVPVLQSRRVWLALAVVVFLYVAFVLRTNLTTGGIFDFVKMYARRDAISGTGNPVLLYLIPWLANAILPIAYASYMRACPWLSSLAVLFCYLFLFVLAGAKMYLLAPLFFVLAFIYYQSGRWSFVVLSLLFSGALVAGPILEQAWEPAGRAVIGIVNLRTFSIQALSPAIYHNYVGYAGFSDFLHIRPLGAIFSPEVLPAISVQLNEAFSLGNLNSNFLFGDGYYGAGYLGMMIMTFLGAVFLFLLDVFSIDEHRLKSFVIVSLFIPSFFNVPLMTSLLTGGGGIIALYFALSKPRRKC